MYEVVFEIDDDLFICRWMLILDYLSGFTGFLFLRDYSEFSFTIVVEERDILSP